MNKRISVALCTFNGAKFIAKQLESIINQKVLVDEVIIGDDCSNDDTVLIAREILRNSGISYRIIENTNRLGVTKNFENVISNCTGDIIFLSDQDDIWNKNKTLVLSNILRDDNCVLAFSDAAVIDSQGGIIMESLLKKDGFMQNGITNDAVIDNILRLNYMIYGCTLAFKKEILHSMLPFFESKGNHDAWIVCCAGLQGNICYTPQKLIKYRIHESNVVGSIHGNKEWERILLKQDRWDRYFSIHDLRSLRVIILTLALKQVHTIDNRFTNEAKKEIVFYNRIQMMKRQSICTRLFWLFFLCLTDLIGFVFVIEEWN